MAPAKKAASKATSSSRSRVPGGAEDEVVSEQPPTEAEDPALSSRAKDELFGDMPKTKEGERPEDSNEHVTPIRTEDATADKPADAVVTEAPDLSPPERHESGSYEQDHADKTADDADFEVEEKDSGE